MIRKSFIYRVESLARVGALQNAGEFSGQIERARVGGVKDHPVDLFRAQVAPGFAAIGGFEQPERRSGVNGVRAARVLSDDVRAPVGARNALDLDPGLAAA